MSDEQKLTHIDEKGKARMVDVTDKEPTKRRAVAQGVITLNEAAYEAVTKGSVPKGDVFAAARIAGIMAAKKTPELILKYRKSLMTYVRVAGRLRTEENEEQQAAG